MPDGREGRGVANAKAARERRVSDFKNIAKVILSTGPESTNNEKEKQ